VTRDDASGTSAATGRAGHDAKIVEVSVSTDTRRVSLAVGGAVAITVLLTGE